MRGKVITKSGKIGSIRITPAYAGKSQWMNVQRLLKQDHPRLCGEKFVQHLQSHLYTGSPPPMRGKAHTMAGDDFHSGITPAYAGKRIFSLFSHAPQTGSPPPMRGKARAYFAVEVPSGITPAYAGKSIVGNEGADLVWDHPRLCGEKCKPLFQATLRNGITPAYAGKSAFDVFPNSAKKGSPPPMRGKGHLKKMKRTVSRITPAYAGKSTSKNLIFEFE